MRLESNTPLDLERHRSIPSTFRARMRHKYSQDQILALAFKKRPFKHCTLLPLHSEAHGDYSSIVPRRYVALTTIPQSKIKSPFFTPLICTGVRQNPTACGTNEGIHKRQFSRSLVDRTSQGGRWPTQGLTAPQGT